MYELVVRESHVKARLSDPDSFQHPRVSQLSLYCLVVELVRYFVPVRFYAPDEERIGLVESVHQRVKRLLELSGDGHRLFARLAELSLICRGDAGSAGQSLHRLQVLQALLAAFSRTKRFVFPKKEIDVLIDARVVRL